MPDATPDDATLVARLRAGDRDAFEALYRRHRRFAWRVAWRETRHADLAAEAVQEAFLDLWRRRASFELRGRLTSYLFPVVRHAALAAVRARRRSERDARESRADAGPARNAEPTDGRAGRLAAAIDALPAPQAEVVRLRIVDGLSTGETALALGIATGTVKSRLHAALATLRTELEESPDEP